MASKWGLKEKLASLQKMKSTLPTKLANEAKNHFLKSFRDQGFTDNSLEKWQPRQTVVKGLGFTGNRLVTKYVGGRLVGGSVLGIKLTKSQVKSYRKDVGRAILVKTGKLKRSIKVSSVSWNRVVIGSYGLKYASVHNYGERAGRGKGFKMPKRQFIGRSQRLERELKGIIDGQFRKILVK